MLAEKYWDYEGKLEGEFYLTTKLDGIRCVLIVEGTDVKMFTRQGQPIEGLVEIEAEARHFLDGVYDGELIALSDTLTDSKDLYKLTSKIVRKDGIKTGVVFHVFDRLSIDGFKKGRYDVPYYNRRGLVDEISRRNISFIKAVPVLATGVFGVDDELIIEKLNWVTGNGGEGVMINLADAPYECKRVRTLLKVKKFKTADVRVLDWYPGTGKYTGMLGGVTIQFEHEGNLHTCDCGSGFTDEERNIFYNDPYLIVGKIIQISYFEVTQNDRGGYGLRFPTFEEVRFDKDEISMY
jgi:DNA ligase-1